MVYFWFSVFCFGFLVVSFCSFIFIGCCLFWLSSFVGGCSCLLWVFVRIFSSLFGNVYFSISFSVFVLLVDLVFFGCLHLLFLICFHNSVRYLCLLFQVCFHNLVFRFPLFILGRQNMCRFQNLCCF